MPIRVIVADDDLLVREGMSALLARVEDIHVLDASQDAEALLAAVELHAPDVVVTDVRMPPTRTDEGIRAAQAIRRSHPGTGVVVLSQAAEPHHALALLEAGSRGRGFLLKERLADPSTLIAAVRTVADGGSVIDPEVVDVMLAHGRARASPLDELSPREREVLAAMAQGMSNGAISNALGLRERAVEKHVGAIFLKLGLRWEQDVSRRVMAVLIFLGGR